MAVFANGNFWSSCGSEVNTEGLRSALSRLRSPRNPGVVITHDLSPNTAYLTPLPDTPINHSTNANGASSDSLNDCFSAVDFDKFQVLDDFNVNSINCRSAITKSVENANEDALSVATTVIGSSELLGSRCVPTMTVVTSCRDAKHSIDSKFVATNTRTMTKSPLGSQNDICKGTSVEPQKSPTKPAPHLKAESNNIYGYLNRKARNSIIITDSLSTTISGLADSGTGFLRRASRNLELDKFTNTKSPKKSKRDGASPKRNSPSPRSISQSPSGSRKGRSINDENSRDHTQTERHDATSPSRKSPRSSQRDHAEKTSPSRKKCREDDHHDNISLSSTSTISSSSRTLNILGSNSQLAKGGSPKDKKSPKDSKNITGKKSPRSSSPFSSPFKKSPFASNDFSLRKDSSNLISTATSALRRLHFKSGRNATKTASRIQIDGSGIPKVIVMGSSSTSENTINTSTDSANTVITMMTNTDGGYTTEESLDKGEDAQHVDLHIDEIQLEPMSPRDTSTVQSSTRDEEYTSETTFLFNDTDDGTPTHTPPRTAFYSEKFTFDTPTGTPKLMPKSPKCLPKKSENTFTFDECNVTNQETSKAKSPSEIKKEISPSRNRTSRRSYYKRRQSEQGSMSADDKPTTRSHSHRRRRSSPRNEYRPSTLVDSNFNMAHDNPMYDLLFASSKSKDFLNNITSSPKPKRDANMCIPTVVIEKRNSICLNSCLRDLQNVGSSLECAFSPCTAAIGTSGNVNVRTNPFDDSVSLSREPQATIVVQQPSMSTDGAVSTMLLKRGSDFVSNVSQKDDTRQHLDVSDIFAQEKKNFESRYGSPHHSRSQSVKTPGRSSGRSNYLCLPQQRARVASMPNTGVEEEYYRLRHFSITGKGIVNRGDSLKSRHSKSNTSVASSNSSNEHLAMQNGPASYPGSARTSVSSRDSSNASGGMFDISELGTALKSHRVAIVGYAAVGKSSLVSQFMTSEYLHAYDTSIDDESGEKSVSVLLSGEESELTFVDLSFVDLLPDDILGSYGSNIQAYCVIFSCVDDESFELAEKILCELYEKGEMATKGVILVANKCDLVRSRLISTEDAKSMAIHYDCKYIETSVSINHNVDELLVGILAQIRLKLKNPEKSKELFQKRQSTRRNRTKLPGITSALTYCHSAGADGRENVQNGEVAESPTTGHRWLRGRSYRERSRERFGSTAEDSSLPTSPRKKRNMRLSASLRVKGLLDRVWMRDSKSKSCENLHVL